MCEHADVDSEAVTTTPDLKPRSRDVTDGLEKTAARGMLRAVGLGDEDFAKPQIGVASSWNEITPCNLSLQRLAQASKDGVHAAGGYPLEFGTISVSDGIAMGHEGMHFSLVSREVIADSVETVMQAERLDGSVLLAGCDKSLPGMLMAAARLDLAAVFLYAGSILPGRAKLSDGSERDVTIIDAFEAVGACARGLMSREDVDAIERAICPGEGACGGMYTANTMASAAEALGMSLPGSAAPPATDRRRDGYARRSGAAVVELLRQGITARDILTREAFENAIAVVMAFGGSTNAVLHLLAIAHEAEVELTLDDFTKIGQKVPHLADVKPFGRHVMTDIDRVGGVPVVMKALLDAGLMHGDALTVTGRTLAENLAELMPPDIDGTVVRSLQRADPPHRRHHDPPRLAGAGGRRRQERRLRRGRLRGHRARLRPRARGDGRAGGRHDRGRRRRRHPLRGPEGRARDARDARDHRGDQGRRASARTCCCSPTAASPGGTTGLCVGHVAPEAVDAGPIAFVRDGDRIRLDVARGHARPARGRGRAGRPPRGLGARCRTATPAACSRSTSGWSAPRRRAPSATDRRGPVRSGPVHLRDLCAWCDVVGPCGAKSSKQALTPLTGPWRGAARSTTAPDRPILQSDACAEGPGGTVVTRRAGWRA